MGRMTSTSQFDVMDPARAAALLVALGRDGRVQAGDALPPFFHHLYFWDAQPPSALGPDGHPKVGGLIPDMGLPRRMWAGGRLEFAAPLRAGVPAEKRSTCAAATRKEGRSGPLAFVTLRHEFWQEGALCVTEHQDLVYRETADPAQPKPTPTVARTDEEASREAAFGTTLLFRYSALTFNGHRIHYDETYARTAEGYDGLVVHGPLLAQLLMLMASDEAALSRFAFRASSPLMHWETATLCRNGADAWVRGPDGRQVMTATIN
ncbi:MaoC family dehydratase N-terminal domain-containing protein [Aestuariicoccus sp. MJ-SS9]|uniref:FAS1-like dehydratase domain-containing protein n=1 Tax=Aestuariicoccus sp. MJ-SS9 TaxID=3079855 RepID=UPI0029061979|nr:MaoC family dehydratase N-terminal domain-containing protein [Aestuariicoccus sp. MJ-SS9]MDU8910179.1 acyl dehydratase [Aestuariicoccus sp. MJ-SS9]